MRQSTQIHILFECFSSTIHCITFHFIYSLSHCLLRVDLLCKRKLFSIYLFIFISRWSIFFRMQMKWKKLWLLFTRSAMIFIPQNISLERFAFFVIVNDPWRINAKVKIKWHREMKNEINQYAKNPHRLLFLLFLRHFFLL